MFSLDFLKALVNVPSPSGREGRAAELFRNYLEPFAHEIQTDIHGNVWAALNPHAETKILLAGHLDEIGFVVSYIDDDGLIYFKGVGGHDPVIAPGQRVWVHGIERQIPGAIGRIAVHLLQENEEGKKKLPDLEDMWIDIGVTSREEAEALVEIGDVVTYQPEFQRLEGDRAIARGFDNKMGCFIVAEAFREIHERGIRDDVGVYALATVQEEIGFRGAITAAYTIHAQTGLVVDVSHATDYPGVNRKRYGRLDIGKGPIITRGAYMHPSVYDGLLQAAKAENIPFQIEVAAECTGTDATPMQVSREGMAVGLLGVPLRYMHTPCELLSLTDVENCARLMAAFSLRHHPPAERAE